MDDVVVVVVGDGDNGDGVVAVVGGGGGVVKFSNRGVLGRIGCTGLSLQPRPYSSVAQSFINGR